MSLDTGKSTHRQGVSNEHSLTRQVDALIKSLHKISKEFSPEYRKKLFDRKAQIFVNAAKAKAPVSQRTHYFVNSRGERATIVPGNLKRSIQILQLKRAPHATFVGPKVTRKQLKGTYRGNRVNAFYAHWVEFGRAGMRKQPFMRPAFDENKGVFIGLITNALRAKLRIVVAKEERFLKMMSSKWI